jgi:hypothetical protein
MEWGNTFTPAFKRNKPQRPVVQAHVMLAVFGLKKQAKNTASHPVFFHFFA